MESFLPWTPYLQPQQPYEDIRAWVGGNVVEHGIYLVFYSVFSYISTHFIEPSRGLSCL
jgi:hypothetical protein